jgi:hypothetical protein
VTHTDATLLQRDPHSIIGHGVHGMSNMVVPPTTTRVVWNTVHQVKLPQGYFMPVVPATHTPCAKIAQQSDQMRAVQTPYSGMASEERIETQRMELQRAVVAAAASPGPAQLPRNLSCHHAAQARSAAWTAWQPALTKPVARCSSPAMLVSPPTLAVRVTANADEEANAWAEAEAEVDVKATATTASHSSQVKLSTPPAQAVPARISNVEAEEPTKHSEPPAANGRTDSGYGGLHHSRKRSRNGGLDSLALLSRTACLLLTPCGRTDGLGVPEAKRLASVSAGARVVKGERLP